MVDGVHHAADALAAVAREQEAAEQREQQRAAGAEHRELVVDADAGDRCHGPAEREEHRRTSVHGSASARRPPERG